MPDPNDVTGGLYDGTIPYQQAFLNTLGPVAPDYTPRDPNIDFMTRLRNLSDPNAGTIQPYTPNITEQLTDYLRGDQRPSVEKAATLSGLQNTLDWMTPVGAVSGAQDALRQGDYKGAALAGFSALPGFGAAERGATRLGEEAAARAPSYFETWHASPYNFENYDYSKIGTGEGNQAYSHGLYYAQNPAVSGRGGEYDQMITARNLGVPDLTASQYFILRSMGEGKSDLQILRDMADRNALGTFDDAQAALDQVHAARAHIYQNAVYADPSHFLDWDKPISQQTPHVQGVLSQILDPQYPASNKGSQVYSSLVARLQAPAVDFLSKSAGSYRADASELLRNAGIPGMRYLDAGSRNLPEYIIGGPHIDTGQYSVGSKRGAFSTHAAGPFDTKEEAQAWIGRNAPKTTSNFVTFSDDIVKILKKYGIGALGIGTGASLAHFQMPDDSPQ